MIQIYLLSVIGCLAGGLLLLSSQLMEKYPAIAFIRNWYNENSAYQPFIFCVYAVIGILVFIYPYHGIPVIGDLIPALINLCTAFILFLEYYQQRAQILSPSFEKVVSFFEHYKGAFGAVSLIAGIAHFLFPGVIFL